MNLLFYAAGAVAVCATLFVVLGKNAVHSLLYLIVSLLAVAMVFFTLGAPFVAVLEVIVYAGAIMVLFVFVIMMLNLGRESVEQEIEWLNRRIWVGPSILTGLLLVLVLRVLTSGDNANVAQRVVDTKQVSLALYGPYLLVVELASMLLLAGLVAAYHLGRRGNGAKEVA